MKSANKKGTVKKVLHYVGRYRVHLAFSIILAAASVFDIFLVGIDHVVYVVVSGLCIAILHLVVDADADTGCGHADKPPSAPLTNFVGDTEAVRHLSLIHI